MTLELRKVEACAREEEHNKVQDDGNCRWFYRQHLEQERGVTSLEGKQVDEDFIIFETFIPKQTNKGCGQCRNRQNHGRRFRTNVNVGRPTIILDRRFSLQNDQRRCDHAART